MPRPNTLSRTLQTGLALAAAASALLLSGCAPEGADSSGSTPPEASESAAPTEPAATSTPEPTEEPVPFEIACDALLTAQDVYDFNPNFGSAPDYEPTAEGVVGVTEESGTACGWLNQTSGEVIEVGVATPPTGALETRMNAAAMASTPVPTYGTPPEVEGYFAQAGGTGEAQVFSGPYWIVLDSEALFEPGDAQQLVAAVLRNLPPA
jgi:hypothetical protein